MENRDENSFGITDIFTDSDSFADSIFNDPTSLETLQSVEDNADTDEEDKNKINKENNDNNNVDVVPESKIISPDDIFGSEEETEPQPSNLDKNPKVGIESTKDEEDITPESNIADFSKELYNIGFFTKFEDEEEQEIKTEQDLLDRLNKEKEFGSKALVYNLLKKKHGQIGVDIFDSIFIKGVAPKDYFARFDKIRSLSSLDIEGEDNVENQKTIYREFFKRQGLSEDEIEKDLNRELEYGELEEKVKKYHPLIIRQEQKELQKLEQEAEQKSRLAQKAEQEYNQTIASIIDSKIKEKEFDGIPFSEKEGKDLYSYITAKKWEIPSTGELLTDFDAWLLDLRRPENWEKRLKFALLAQSNLDLSKIKKKAVTEEKNSIFSSLHKKNKIVTREPKNDLEDFLKGL